jgi:membrane associated rhomboid family serine protease
VEWDTLVLVAGIANVIGAAGLVVTGRARPEWPHLVLLATAGAGAMATGITGLGATPVALPTMALSLALVVGPRQADRWERRALASWDFRGARRAARLRALVAPGGRARAMRVRVSQLAGLYALLHRGDGDAAAARVVALATEEERAPRLVIPGLERAPARGGDAAARIALELAFVAACGRSALARELVRGPLGERLSPSQRRFVDDRIAREAEVEEALALARPGALALCIAPATVVALAATLTRLRREAAAAAGAGRARRTPMATVSLAGANVAAYAALAAWSHAQPGIGFEAALVRGGALFRPAITAGEWWRLCTAPFVHAGWVHLAVNVWGLWMLGRFVEGAFGPARFVAVYLASALVASVASAALGGGAISVGASGAVLGLVGALVATLVLRRGAWPERWRRALLGALVLLAAAQVALGFAIPAVDNAAHVGGLVGGAMAGLMLAPGGVVRTGWVARGVSAAFVVANVVAAALATSTPLDATLLRLVR